MINTKQDLLKASLLALTLLSLASIPARAEKRTVARDTTLKKLDQACQNEEATSTLADYTTGKLSCGWADGDTRECEVFSTGEALCEDTPAQATRVDRLPVQSLPARQRVSGF